MLSQNSGKNGVANAAVNVAALTPHPRNYNQHSAGQVGDLRRSLRRFGQVRSIVVQAQADGLHHLIVAGHGIVTAARAEGIETLRADIIPADWDDAMVLAYLAADNELARQGQPDEAQLAALLRDVQATADRELAALAAGSEARLTEMLATLDGGAAGDADVDAQIEDYPVADLLAPFPYFGGKRALAGAVWARFGEIENYVEPFFGSGAMLLSRPDVAGIETVNDLNGFVANFWRAVAAAPDAVAKHVDWPVNENDLFARHLWLVSQRDDLTRQLHTDPAWYDAKIAGWWCWGACNWIGTGWCSGDGPWRVEDGAVTSRNVEGVRRKLPHVGDAGRGVNRQLPHVGDAGQGVNRQLPHVGNAGQGVTDGQCAAWSTHLQAMMGKLSDRLRRVRVACGDWRRVTTGVVTDRHGLTGVFLDPPYGVGAMEYSAGGNADGSIASAVRDWCIEHSANPSLRIALCGYDPLTMPADWTALRWTAPGGYGNQGNKDSRKREVVWFSPHCLKPAAGAKMDVMDADDEAGAE